MLLGTTSFAQRPWVINGNIEVLNGVKKMNVQYDYSNMQVGRKSETDYVGEKTEIYNDRQPGKGDKWAKNWVDDRQARFEPMFEVEFNKRGAIQVGSFPNEKYTLIFRTLRTEPGYNVGIQRRNAYIDCQVSIVETANQNNIICTIQIKNCQGHTFWGMDFDTGERIKEAYATAGRVLAKYFRKNLD